MRALGVLDAELQRWEDAQSQLVQVLHIQHRDLPPGYADARYTERLLGNISRHMRMPKRATKPKVGGQKLKPNALCHCGSGAKYKKCYMNKN